jgi:5,10-methylene-tetrahydrofolate dehydrogenase/methenyl tetrahydrofolate cyclohydrolase
MLISVRNRYNSLQLFEKLGGDLQRLKGKNQDQNELMQLNLNYQNLENEKNVIESKLKESELIIQMKDQLILRMKIEQDELKKQIHHLNSIISTPIVSTPIVSTPIASKYDPTKHLKNIVVKGVEFNMLKWQVFT